MSSVAEALQPFVCGGLSACIASTVIHPIDLTKVRLQLAAEAARSETVQAPKPSAMSVIRDVVQKEGFPGLYSGLSAALTRQATYGTARIGLHRTFSDKLVELNGGAQIPFWQKACAGIISGAAAVCIGNAFDVSLVRMQADGNKPMDQRRGYKNVFDALFKIGTTEGIRGLWSGLTPNILRGVAMNVGMLACYDEAKESIVEITKDPDSLTTRLSASAVAGFCCAFLSLPFDMIKSRLQNRRPGMTPYTGVVSCATFILRNEGPLAFWTGFTAYYLRCAPHAMVILLTIPEITSVYKKLFGLEADVDYRIAARFTSSGTVQNLNDDEEDDDERDE